MVLIILTAIFLALCIFAAVHDVNRLKIPNWLNLTLALLFVPAAAVSGLSLEMIGGHLLAGLLAFVAAYGLFMFRIFGGGDAKMIPAVMLWIGPSAAIPFVYWMALVGGLCALIVLTIRKTVPVEVLPGFVQAPFRENGSVPYGVAIAAGVLLAGAQSPLMAPFFSMAGFVG